MEAIYNMQTAKEAESELVYGKKYTVMGTRGTEGKGKIEVLNELGERKWYKASKFIINDFFFDLLAKGIGLF